MPWRLAGVKVLVLGATGMLGSAMLRILAESKALETSGTIRSEDSRAKVPVSISTRLVLLEDVRDYEALEELFRRLRPDVVVNCISPSRDALQKCDALALIPICALLPHQLAQLCERHGARLVHFSTDGVFSGKKGSYTEDDIPDATDVYGVSKRLGEVRGSHTITIRTSMLGHELRNSQGLLEWFLSQTGRCKCFSRAVFSGLPTVVLARIVRDFVLPHPEISDVYHVASQPINKCELLRLIAQTYEKEIEIDPDDAVVIDRSLNAERFRAATGYLAPGWPSLIQTMHSFR